MSAGLTSYIVSFDEKLLGVDVEGFSLEPYPKEYLQLLINNSTYYLHIYAHVLDKLMQHTTKQKEEIVLIDYGAGNGLLGIFAKHCGFKKVYLNDYSPLFLDASKQLAVALNIIIDGFIEGDCEAVAAYCKTNELPNAVIGTDVIEHIYSLRDFFGCLSSINKNIINVFTTASVTANPIKNKQLKRLQLADEMMGSNATHAMPGDEYAGLPFIETRKRIIKKEFIQLKDEVVKQLAVATRGLNKEDIIQAVNKFVADGTLPTSPFHGTNTCDPITGSWTERLLTIEEYQKIYSTAGIKLTTYNGFYNQWQGGVKAIGLRLANKTIALLGKQGDVISPFITLVGTDLKKPY